ncbi:hypothetical protein GCM10020295_21630 [Streptomyces cinereospinus]
MFSETSMISFTPCSASHRVSFSTSPGRREMKEPRKDGMAQKEQRRSQPEASLTEATGLPSSPAPQRRARAGGRGEALRQVRGSTVARQRHVGRRLPLGRADRQQLAPVARGVRGVDAAVQDGLQPVGDVGVVVEAEHAVGLGERLGEFLAVPLGHAAHRHHGLGSAVPLEVIGLQEGVDGVLLGGVDETARVHDGDVRFLGVLDELPAVRLQTACELLRVHLVTGAAKGDECDGTAFRHGLKTTSSR